MEDRIVSFLAAGSPSPRFHRAVTTIAPGGSLPYRASAWRDAIVLVDRGSVEIRTADGRLFGFDSGDVLWLDGLPIRSLRNPGSVPAVLVGVSRRVTDPF